MSLSRYAFPPQQLMLGVLGSRFFVHFIPSERREREGEMSRVNIVVLLIDYLTGAEN